MFKTHSNFLKPQSTIQVWKTMRSVSESRACAQPLTKQFHSWVIKKLCTWRHEKTCTRMFMDGLECSCYIHNSSKLERTQMIINSRVDRYTVHIHTYPCDGIPCSKGMSESLLPTTIGILSNITLNKLETGTRPEWFQYINYINKQN